MTKGGISTSLRQEKNVPYLPVHIPTDPVDGSVGIGRQVIIIRVCLVRATPSPKFLASLGTSDILATLHAIQKIFFFIIGV